MDRREFIKYLGVVTAGMLVDSCTNRVSNNSLLADKEPSKELLEKYPLVSCTNCDNCLPCPYGIDIPGIFKYYNDNIQAGTHVVSKKQKNYSKLRRKYLAEYNNAIPAAKQANRCIDCHRCERRCPQQIRIADELHRINRYVDNLRHETL